MNKVVAISKPARTGPPPDLAAEERALWVHLQAEYDLQDAGAIVLLGLLCRNLQLSRECRETVAAQGKVTQTGREHPLLKVQRDADKQATIALKALNLDLEPLRSGPGRPAGR